jgi:hypothetical protein
MPSVTDIRAKADAKSESEPILVYTIHNVIARAPARNI